MLIALASRQLCAKHDQRAPLALQLAADDGSSPSKEHSCSAGYVHRNPTTHTPIKITTRQKAGYWPQSRQRYQSMFPSLTVRGTSLLAQKASLPSAARTPALCHAIGGKSDGTYPRNERIRITINTHFKLILHMKGRE